MKLFKIEIRFTHRRKGRTGVDTVVHAKSRAAAEAYVLGKFTGCEIAKTIELENAPKHFVVADVVDD
jgi:hypothetical protein